MVSLAVIMRAAAAATPKSGSSQHESTQSQWQLLESVLRSNSRVALMHPGALRHYLPHKVGTRCDALQSCGALSHDLSSVIHMLGPPDCECLSISGCSS